MVRAWLQSNYREIAQDKGLIYFGSALCFIHVVSYYFMFRGYTLGSLSLENGYGQTCWPFWDSCEKIRVLSQGTLDFLTTAYLITAWIGTLLFLRKRTLKWGLVVLAALNVFKLAFYYAEARYFGNYHVMPFMVTLVYFFFPDKWNAIRVLHVSFYFFAGILKLNPEWLSGSASALIFYKWTAVRFLLDDYPMLFKLAHAAIALLELWFIWLLLSSKAARIWFVYALLMLFHIFSWAATGYFYPMIMFALLAFVPLMLLVSKKPVFHFPRYRLFLALFAVFCLGQIWPKIVPGDEALTGEGRWSALTMYDAYSRCFDYTAVRRKNEWIELPFTMRDYRAVRSHCDPYFRRERAHQFCREYAMDPHFERLEMIMWNKRTMSKEYQLRIKEKDFCKASADYNGLWRNDWIRL